MNLKKIVAFSMVATMVMGSSLTVLATDVTADLGAGSEKEITGEGTEVYASKNIMKVALPTNLENLFDYKVDPDGLISTAKKYGTVELTSVEGDTGVLFKNANSSGATTTYSASNVSDPVSIINKSMIPVEIGVTATLTAADSQPIALTTLSTTADFSGTGDSSKALYLGLYPTNDTIRALGSSAVTANNILLDAADQYALSVDSSGNYSWAVPDESKAEYPVFNFYLTGAINKDVAASTWYTETDGTRTANNPPKVSVKFTLTGVKDVVSASAAFIENDLYVWKTSDGLTTGGGFSADPTSFTINGKTVTVTGLAVSLGNDYTTKCIKVPFATVANLFGTYTSDQISKMSAEEKATITGYVKAVKAVADSNNYYCEIE